jgi:hypothetical protein
LRLRLWPSAEPAVAGGGPQPGCARRNREQIEGIGN